MISKINVKSIILVFPDEKEKFVFTDINMELDKDKSLCDDMNLNWLSSKVTAVGPEVRGIWYNGDTNKKVFHLMRI